MSALRATGVNPAGVNSYYANATQSEEELKYQNQVIESSVAARAAAALPKQQIALANMASKMAIMTDAAKGLIASMPAAAGAMNDVLIGLTGLSTLTSAGSAAKKQAASNTYLNNAAKNIYSGVTPGSASVNAGLLTRSMGNMKGFAATAGTGLMMNDLLSGSFLANGTTSAATKAAFSIANPAFGAMNLMGGFGSVGKSLTSFAGIKGGALAGALDMAAGFGAFMAVNKAFGALGSKLQSLDPNSAKNANKAKFSTVGDHRRSPSEDPVASGKHSRMASLLTTMGPNGLQQLTVAESMSIGLLNDINYNTSFMPRLLEIMDGLDPRTRSKNHGNHILNSAIDKFGVQDGTGAEFNNLLRNGKPGSLTAGLLNFYGFSNNMSALNPVSLLPNLFNRNDINSGAWSIRDAKMYGDKLAADKKTAQAFGLSLNSMNLISQDLDSWLSNLDDKQLGLLYYMAKVQRLSAEKLIEIARGMGTGSGESIGSMKDRLNREQELERQGKYNFFIDGILRGADDLIRTVPVLKALSPVLHAGMGLGKGALGAAKFIGNPLDGISRMNGFFSNVYKEAKESFVDKFIDPTLKNKDTLLAEVGMKEATYEERFYKYYVDVYPNEFKKLLKAVGVQNVSDKVLDIYTGDWITKEEFTQRNQERSDKLNGLTTNLLPGDDSLGGYLKEAIGKRFFGIKDLNIDATKVMDENYKHIQETIDKFAENIKNIQDEDVVLDPTNKPKNSKGKMLSNWYLRGIEANTASMLKQMETCCESQTKLISNFANPFKKNTSVGDLINFREKESREETLYKMSIENLPYIRRIFDVIDSGTFSKDVSILPKNKKPEENDFGGGIVGWLIDGISSLFGFGGKNKGKGSWLGKMFGMGAAGAAGWGFKDLFTKFSKENLKNFAKNPLKVMTLLRGLGPALANPVVATLAAIAVIGSTIYMFKDELADFIDDAKDMLGFGSANVTQKDIVQNSNIKKLEDINLSTQQQFLNKLNGKVPSGMIIDPKSGQLVEAPQLFPEEFLSEQKESVKKQDETIKEQKITNEKLNTLINVSTESQSRKILNEIEKNGIGIFGSAGKLTEKIDMRNGPEGEKVFDRYNKSYALANQITGQFRNNLAASYNIPRIADYANGNFVIPERRENFNVNVIVKENYKKFMESTQNSYNQQTDYNIRRDNYNNQQLIQQQQENQNQSSIESIKNELKLLNESGTTQTVASIKVLEETTNSLNNIVNQNAQILNKVAQEKENSKKFILNEDIVNNIFTLRNALNIK